MPDSKDLSEIYTRAIAILEKNRPKEEQSLRVAILYCKSRAEGSNRARAELQAFNEYKEGAPDVGAEQLKKIIRSGLDAGTDTWFVAYRHTP